MAHKPKVANPWRNNNARPGNNGGGNKVWCKNHKTGGHNRSECRGVSKDWVLWADRRRKDAERNKDGQQANAAEDKDTSPNEGEKAEVTATLAQYAMIAANGGDEAIILDSGASGVFIKNKHLLHELAPLNKPFPITVGSGAKVMATHRGVLCVGKAVYDRAYYVPDMSYNLLSAQQLGPAQLGAHWRISADFAELKTGKGDTVLTATRKGGLLIVSDKLARTSSPTHIALSAKEEADTQDNRLLRWHCRLRRSSTSLGAGVRRAPGKGVDRRVPPS